MCYSCVIKNDLLLFFKRSSRFLFDLNVCLIIKVNERVNNGYILYVLNNISDIVMKWFVCFNWMDEVFEFLFFELLVFF